jgi:hypothetical protein
MANCKYGQNKPHSMAAQNSSKIGLARTLNASVYVHTIFYHRIKQTPSLKTFHARLHPESYGLFIRTVNSRPFKSQYQAGAQLHFLAFAGAVRGEHSNSTQQLFSSGRVSMRQTFVHFPHHLPHSIALRA